jgi:amidase
MVPLEFGSDIGGSIRMPAHFRGVYGHKPSFNLVPSRGHQPPGTPEGAGVLLAVVGPLARTAADLGLALDVVAGPDAADAVGYRLVLPRARHDRLGEYRVLVLSDAPQMPVDDEIRAGIEGLGDKLAALGAKVTRGGGPVPDFDEVQRVYMGILMPTVSRGQPGAEVISAHEWMALLDAQAQLRRQWARLFEDFDVVLAPVHGAAAFPHDDEPDMSKRVLTLNGRQVPYFAPAGWAGLATSANLPATAVPVGRTRAGLPYGLQVIGPYLEDRTTLAFAALAEREFGGFQAPPGF